MTSHVLQKSECIGGYVLVDRLGAGGYGEVWKVEAPGGLAKAMKLVYGRFDESRATRELKALHLIKEVRHPFLCNIERFEVIDGQLIMVTELADMSLKDRYEECRSEKQPGIPREELIDFLRDAADALDYMGQKHALQHLDVKPENLLLLSGHVKVADFGLVKGLQTGATMSLVSGLTPIYAAPEVFDDQPTSHSDQYSLAIVYQEMLTGLLPFPGRTPAQLAAQHISGRPRLEKLPASDREIIARALSKDPEKRFKSCLDLIKALRDAGHASTRAEREATRSDEEPDADTTSLACGDTNLVRPPKRQEVEAAAALKTEELDDEQRDAVKHSTANSRLRLRRSSAQAKCDDLGPIEIEGLAATLRPTLILGAGGTAARIMGQLHAGLTNRFGDLSNVPAIQMVLVDTDAKSHDQPSRDACTARVPHELFCAAPLRKTQDYRESSNDILRWMSRRWLYNIPRSLETEGIRPLGRLALVDHASKITRKIQQAIETCTSETALTESLAATELPGSDPTLRVIVIASISGGSGSGMVIDLGYMTRQILKQLGMKRHTISAFLTHSTSSKPSQRDLAIANAFACLNELYQFNMTGGGFPGDDACNLEAVDSRMQTFDDTYLLQLGDELPEDELNKAATKLATYLQFEIASAWGPLLEHCRLEDRTADAVFGEPVIRTFDLSEIGCDLREVARREVRNVCEQVVRRWCGIHLSSEEAAKSGEEAEQAEPNADQRSADQAKELGLEVDSLAAAMIEHARKTLQIEEDTGFETVVEKLVLAREESNRAGAVQLAPSELFRIVDEIISTDIGDKQKARGMVRRRLQQSAQQLTRQLDGGIRDFVTGIANSPNGRLSAALASTAWFRSHLRKIAEDSQNQLNELSHELNEIANVLSDPKNHDKRRWWSRKGGSGGGGVGEQLRHQFINQRVQYAALEEVFAFAERLCQQLGSLNDELLHAQHSLKPLLSHYLSEQDQPAAVEDEFDDEEPILDFTGTVNEAFRGRLSNLVTALDEKFDSEVLQAEGGLLDICQREGQLADLLAHRLEAAAQSLVLTASREIDVAQLFLDSCGSEDQAAQEIKDCSNSASSANLKCGGTRRLIAAIPHSAGSEKLQSIITDCLEPTPTVIAATEHDIVVGCEQASLPLVAVAARLVEDRPDLIALAQRIHTRSDVEWCSIIEDDELAAV